MKAKKIFKIFSILFFVLFGLYLSLVFFLPFILNSKQVQTAIIHQIEEKKCAKISFEGLNFSISPSLKFIGNLNKLSIDKAHTPVFILDNAEFSYSFFIKKENFLSIKKVYLSFNPKFDKKSKSTFNMDKINLLPSIKINEGEIYFGKSQFLFKDFLFEKGEISTISFDLTCYLKYINLPLKINKKNKIFIENEEIYTDNLEIDFLTSKLFVNGALYSPKGVDFRVYGKNLDVNTMERIFVSLYRRIKNKKHFIENFEKFGGKYYVDLHFKKNQINGKISIDNLCAKSVLLSVPLRFKKADFIFKDKNISMSTKGFIGGQNAVWNFFLSGIFTDNLTVFGNVEALVGDDFAKKYVDGLNIKNHLKLNVEYLTEKGTVNVLYNAKLPTGSNLSYCRANLGLENLDREFDVATIKTGDKIKLTHFGYSVIQEGQKQELLFGWGDFEKIKNKTVLTKLVVHTIEDVPVSLLAFLEDRLIGGTFNGNFEFDFIKEKFIGSIIISNTKFKNFFAKNAAVFGDEKFLSVLSEGKFKKEPFACEIIFKNDFGNTIYIDKLSLYLRKFTLKQPKKHRNAHFKIPDKKFNESKKVVAKNIELRLDKFEKDKISIENIRLFGSAINDTFNFNMKDIDFADGKLSAEGYFKFDEHMLDVNFSADNIDSNQVGYEVFNLKDQFEGKAFANLHLIIQDKLTNIKGKGDFKIKNGKLSKITSSKIAPKIKNHKFSDIIKIRKNTKIDEYSDITGYFDIFNSNLENINIYMQNDSISLFIEGKYNLGTEEANLNIWGKYDNSTASKIKIFHIPLTWITALVFNTEKLSQEVALKIKKTPEIIAKAADIKNFVVKLKGHINNPKGCKIELFHFK